MDLLECIVNDPLNWFRRSINQSQNAIYSITRQVDICDNCTNIAHLIRRDAFRRECFIGVHGRISWYRRELARVVALRVRIQFHFWSRRLGDGNGNYSTSRTISIKLERRQKWIKDLPVSLLVFSTHLHTLSLYVIVSHSVSVHKRGKWSHGGASQALSVPAHTSPTSIRLAISFLAISPNYTTSQTGPIHVLWKFSAYRFCYLAAILLHPAIGMNWETESSLRSAYFRLDSRIVGRIIEWK